MQKIIAAVLSSLVLSLPAQADVKIEAPWVRATVPQQKATGAFLRITASADSRLVAVQSPVAGRAEIHEMLHDKEVMKMRPVKAVELPAGKAVELKPGGHHVMLLDLKRAIREGDTVPLVLTVEGSDGRRETIEVAAPARPLGATGGELHGH